jgi:hypothetical protein
MNKWANTAQEIGSHKYQVDDYLIPYMDTAILFSRRRRRRVLIDFHILTVCLQISTENFIIAMVSNLL